MPVEIQIIRLHCRAVLPDPAETFGGTRLVPCCAESRQKHCRNDCHDGNRDHELQQGEFFHKLLFLPDVDDLKSDVIILYF